MEALREVDAIGTGARAFARGSGLRTQRKPPGAAGTPNNRAAATASAVLAFELHGHLLPLSSEGEYARKAAFDEDPYLDNVERGLAHVLTELSPLPIGLQNGEDPDANHNGIGLEVTLESRPVYIGGQVVDAITATMDPVRTATTGGPDVLGRTYAEIVQDILDAYAWGQTDDARGGCPVTPTASPSPAGGWRYC